MVILVDFPCLGSPERFSVKSLEPSKHDANFTSLQRSIPYLTLPLLCSLILNSCTISHLFKPESSLHKPSANMTHKLPPNLLALFAARPALRYLPPNDHAPEERKTNNIGGIAQYLSAIEDYKETVPYEPTESWLQRKDRVKLEKKEKQEQLTKEGSSRSMRFAPLSSTELVRTCRLT